MSEAQELLKKLAAKLRSRAEWCHDGYYTDERESIVNSATRNVLEGVASDIEELLLPEPDDAART